MNTKSLLSLAAAAGLGFGSSYLLKRKNSSQEPDWAKNLRSRINIVRGDTLLEWEFLDIGGGGNETYYESANYACWRPLTRVDGSQARDMDANLEIWNSYDGMDFIIEIYHALDAMIYFDGQMIEHDEPHMTRFNLD